MASDAVSRVPNELWGMIKSYVVPLSKHVIADALRFKPTPEDKHSRVWNSIFQNENWLSAMTERGLNPVLIGHDLHHIYHAKNITTKYPKTKYLVLVLGYDRDGGKYKPSVEDKIDLLESSLKPHSLKDTERFFAGPRIVLNIRDAKFDDNNTSITQPRRLVSRKLGGLYSAYLYWKDDSFKVRTIGPEHIVGIGRALTKKNVSNIVGLTWEHLPGKNLRQHCFELWGAGMGGKVDQIHNGKWGSSFKVIGWKWKRTFL
jgi:hypothetical protein